MRLTITKEALPCSTLAIGAKYTDEKGMACPLRCDSLDAPKFSPYRNIFIKFAGLRERDI